MQVGRIGRNDLPEQPGFPLLSMEVFQELAKTGEEGWLTNDGAFKNVGRYFCSMEVGLPIKALGELL